MRDVAGEYLLGGITLISEIVLPELPRIQRGNPTPHPVTVRLGKVANSLPGAVEIDPDCFASPNHLFLRIHGIGCYLVNNGKEIVVCPEAGASALDVRAYLLGTLFVVLCQQRGLLPLHASAVSAREGVVAFLGRSGQGKSSLAAHLARRSFRVMADDVCLIDPMRTGLAMVMPTAPWLKLWRNSLENLGRQAETLERVFSEDDKYRLPLENSIEAEPIRKLIFLETGGSPVTAIHEVSAIEAVPWLMELTHQAYVLQATGQLEQNFLRCSRVSSQSRAYRLTRPWGLQHLESTVDAVEKLLL